VQVSFDHGGFTRTFEGDLVGTAAIANSMANFDLETIVTDDAAVPGAHCSSGCNSADKGHAGVTFVGTGASHAITSFNIPAISGGGAIDAAVGTSLLKETGP
jgi:hypothetical protein